VILGAVAVALAAPALAAPDGAGSDELWVELGSTDDAARARAAGLAWAEGQEGDWFRLTGRPAQAEALGLAWRPVARAADGYLPDPDAVDAALEALAVGGFAEVVQLGESVAGAPILALHIGHGGRALRVLAGHHGDESSAVVVALAVAEAYATGAVALPADTELWVVPMVNPDGVGAGTRANASGIDLNRNYGWEWGTDEPGAGPSPFSEPETRAVRALARARSFDAGLSLHAGAANLGWVWNWSRDVRPPEEPLLASLAEGYAAACGAPDFWITNGADWYVTHGDTTDWTYGEWGAYDYTLELTTVKAPPEEQAATYTAWHLPAIEAWIGRAADRSATVVDAVTGEPIAARIEGDGVGAAWTGPDGRYVRWSDDPDAPRTATAPGYTSATLAADTRLAPDALLDVLPSPRLLSRGDGPRPVTLPGVSTGPLRLVQPGETDVEVPADGSGSWTVDPAALAPGAWTLVTDAGVVPRALFVGEVSDRVTIDDATLADGVLTLVGSGFARGSEAWSLGGPARAMHALDRLGETDTALRFALPTTDDDVLVWSDGAWLSVVDVQDTPVVDPDPPSDTGTPPVVDDEPLDPALYVAGGCASAPAPPIGWGWVVAAGGAIALGRRRSATLPAGAEQAPVEALALP
jgi:hypothetical protein